MGKYMKKSKVTSDVVAVMEVTSGVCTRAKTLALQQLRSPASPNPDATSTCYLQLRSRRLEKTAPETKKTPTKEKGVNFNCKGASRLRVNSSATTGDSECETEDFDAVKEASFGDNCFDFDRCTRESTPCSLIRDSETIATPGSTTRRRQSAAVNQRLLSSMQRNIPTTCEMDEFFADAEQQQQRLFIEKYNFDIVNDLPLSGRYEWVQVIP